MTFSQSKLKFDNIFYDYFNRLNMPYLTSWDANVFLCLLSVFPEEVVRRMIKDVKKTHEEHVQKESIRYWSESGAVAYEWFRCEKNICLEFKDMWRWRCPETRRKYVVKWTMEGPVGCLRIADPYIDKGEGTSKAGYWNSGEAWWYSINREDDYESSYESSDEELTMEYDTWKRYRRLYVSNWYENIHEGRYFLFFKENDLLSTWHKYRDNQYGYVKCISDVGERWQIAQDLLTIDGPGIGEKVGSKVEHIDDLFSK